MRKSKDMMRKEIETKNLDRDRISNNDIKFKYKKCVGPNHKVTKLATQFCDG